LVEVLEVEATSALVKTGLLVALVEEVGNQVPLVEHQINHLPE
jgi:hypothetical protein